MSCKPASASLDPEVSRRRVEDAFREAERGERPRENEVAIVR